MVEFSFTVYTITHCYAFYTSKSLPQNLIFGISIIMHEEIVKMLNPQE